MIIWLWLGFLALIFVLLALDLGVFHRKDHVITTREALGWTAVWIAVAMLFNVGIYFLYEHHIFGIGKEIGHDIDGSEAALKFLTGYLIEKSLSLDNIFVIAIIFSYFKVKAQYQHRVLFWGILGALLMRGVMIIVGAKMVQNFSWMLYIFGALLLVTAVKMMVAGDEEIEPDKTFIVRLTRKIFPVSSDFEGHHFFTRVGGRFAITPLFLVLMVVEVTDVVFAVDSIPAIFGITTDPFIVFTSNVFAILGLRSLYFALAGMMRAFRHMKSALVFVLVFVGIKLIAQQWHHSHRGPDDPEEIISAELSLAVVVGILFVGVVASMIANRSDVLRDLKKGEGDVKVLGPLAIRQARRLVILVVGLTVVILGLALVVTPGPGLFVAMLGMGILATEFVWARRMFSRAKALAEQAADRVSGMMPGSTPANDENPSRARQWIHEKINVPGESRSENDAAKPPVSGDDKPTA